VGRIAEVEPAEVERYRYKSATIGGIRLSHHNVTSL
jgi:hypothetical protein